MSCRQWGCNLAGDLAALGALAAVSDPSRAVLRGVRALYPGVTVTTDPAGLLADAAIEAVVIATPAAFHAG